MKGVATHCYCITEGVGLEWGWRASPSGRTQARRIRRLLRRGEDLVGHIRESRAGTGAWLLGEQTMAEGKGGQAEGEWREAG